MAKGRRAKGEGAIYKRKDGRWAAQYTVETAAGSKRKTIYGKTRKDVAGKLAKAIADREDGLIFEAGKQTVGEYIDRWLQDSVQGSVRPRTYTRYEQLCRKHVKPALGRIKLKALSPAHVQAMYRDRLQSGLSPTTVQHIHTTLHRALKQAVKWGLIPRNVCEAVDVPKRNSQEAQPLTPAQARRLLKAAEGDPLEALYVLALSTGMRQGELLGLSWGDVDLEGRCLRVRRALVTDSYGKQWFGQPKTNHGRRTIALTQQASTALASHRVLQQNAGLYDPAGLVFCTRKGSTIDPNNVYQRSFKPLLKRADLPSIRFHNLRHTCATLLLGKGVHPKFVQAMLGHATIGITMDLYSHWAPGMGYQAAAAMEDALGEDPAG